MPQAPKLEIINRCGLLQLLTILFKMLICDWNEVGCPLISCLGLDAVRKLALLGLNKFVLHNIECKYVFYRE